MTLLEEFKNKMDKMTRDEFKSLLEDSGFIVEDGNGEITFTEKITPKQALKEIQQLKFYFMGSKNDLHNRIDEIISRVK